MTSRDLRAAKDEREAERQAILDRTAARYAWYTETGYADRWRIENEGQRASALERSAFLVDALSPALGGTVLDFGCGAGELAVLLESVAHRPARFIGIDLVESNVAAARHAAPWAEFLMGSADALPLADASVEAACAMTLLSSLVEPWFRERVLVEVDRVIRPGGRFVVYDLRYPSPGNPAVRPVSAGELRHAFPEWRMTVRAMTLLPPLARHWPGATTTGYRLLARLPALRSHLGVVLVRP